MSDQRSPSNSPERRPGEDGRGEQRPVLRPCSREERIDLVAAEDPHLVVPRPRSLMSLQPAYRIGGQEAMSHSVVEDALEGGEDGEDRIRGESFALQVHHESCDVVDRDRRDREVADPGDGVTAECRLVGLQATRSQADEFVQPESGRIRRA